MEKFGIFCAGLQTFLDAGYLYIGMDHFAKPGDELAVAQQNRTLHRNFQGYTTKAGADLYGMGVSAISGLESSYAQNYRELPRYTAAVARRAHLLHAVERHGCSGALPRQHLFAEDVPAAILIVDDAIKLEAFLESIRQPVEDSLVVLDDVVAFRA